MSLTVLEINTSPRHGFFSAFFGALRGIRDAEVTGNVPIVVWDERSPYHNKHGGNAWLQFFDQVSTITEMNVDKVRKREYCGWDGIQCYENTGILETLSVLYRKYIRIKPEVMSALPVVPKGMLGVHYRGTDKLTSKEFQACPIKELIDKLKASKMYKDNPFFFATDDIDALSQMKAEFPEMLYNPCIRSSLKSIHGHYDYINETKTPTKDGPIKGKQVLVDALTLAKCVHIMRCPSGVSLFSIVASEQTWMDYTSHRWEEFLQQSTRNIRFYDVTHVEYLHDLGDIVWVTNRLPPTEQQTKTIRNRKRDIYIVQSFHELVNPKSVFDEKSIQFAIDVLRAILPNYVVDVDNNVLFNQPIITSCEDFLIICSKQLWNDINSKILVPLYNDQIRYNNEKASIPLQMVPKFTLLMISMCTRDIGML